MFWLINICKKIKIIIFVQKRTFFWTNQMFLIFFHIFISQNLFFWNFNILKQFLTKIKYSKEHVWTIPKTLFMVIFGKHLFNKCLSPINLRILGGFSRNNHGF